jgi:hypothetical protein
MKLWKFLDTSVLLYTALYCYILLYTVIYCYILLYTAIYCYILLYTAIYCYLKCLVYDKLLKPRQSFFIKLCTHTHTHTHTHIYIYIYVYRVSQEECTTIRENVPYVIVHRYNPKQPYPNLNGYGGNGQRKVWSSCGSTYCNCSADALLVHCPCPSLTRVECIQQSYCVTNGCTELQKNFLCFPTCNIVTCILCMDFAIAMHVLLLENTKGVFPIEGFRLEVYLLRFTRHCVRLVVFWVLLCMSEREVVRTINTCENILEMV